MNAARIDSILREQYMFEDSNGVDIDDAYKVFTDCLSEDGFAQHEINYGLADEEELWNDYCTDTELQLL
jgi:hypothetical protein